MSFQILCMSAAASISSTPRWWGRRRDPSAGTVNYRALLVRTSLLLMGLFWIGLSFVHAMVFLSCSTGAGGSAGFALCVPHLLFASIPCHAVLTVDG